MSLIEVVETQVDLWVIILYQYLVKLEVLWDISELSNFKQITLETVPSE